MSTLKEEAARFKPVDISRLREDEHFTDAMRVACSLYNSALGEIDAGSLSAARSDLRKATALCPEFNYAVILYGICTFFSGDRTGAMRIFNSVKSPQERSRAMKLYDRLVDDELSVSAAEISGARLRKSLETFDDGHVDNAYLKRSGGYISEAEAEYQPPRSLFIDGEQGEGDGSVRVVTTGWSPRRSEPGEAQPGTETDGTESTGTGTGRKKTVVTLHQIPGLEPPKKKRSLSGSLLVIIIVLLLLALLVTSIGWAVERAKRRKLERADSVTANSVCVVPGAAEGAGYDGRSGELFY